MQVEVVLEHKAIDDLESGLGTVLLGHRDGPAQLDDGRVGEAAELA